MGFLLTMPDLTWTVRVSRWTWIYKFTKAGSGSGTVTWRDPWNGMHGNGTWRLDAGKLVTRWPSGATDKWDLPIDPRAATGQSFMADGTYYELNAVAQDYFLSPGDVVYSGQNIIRGNGVSATIVYQDEVKTGGTVAWLCNNPGNIREAAAYGAFKGKHLVVKGVGQFAIFPDENSGLMAVVAVLQVYGRVTIRQAMNKYAPKKDGHNDPDQYAATVAAGMKMSVDTYLTTLSDEQILRMAMLMTGVETVTKGTSWSRDDPAMPSDIRQRLLAA